jgi:hypothetical protein
MIEHECKRTLHTVQAKAQYIVTKVTYALQRLHPSLDTCDPLIC